MPGKLDGSKSIASGTITTTQLATALSDSIAAGGGPKIKSLIYPGDDTAANTVGGQTIYINGSGFDSNVAVYVNNASVPSVTYISASNVGFTTPALSAATYPLYVTNPDDGATAILVPGLQISGEPTWVTGATLTTQEATVAWSISLSATGDTPLTYALAAGSSLPSGISLASNGVISGTMSSPPASETTYNFTVDVSDAQNQTSSRAFSVTVTTGEGVLFANNVLLIHADGTNNGNNHSFLDSSNNNFTITRAGNSTQGSFSPFSQTGWSGFFDGTGDYLTTNNSNVNNFGTSDWTIEFWINSTQTLRADPIGWNYLYSSAGWAGLILNVAGSGSQMSWYEGSNQRINATNTGWNNGAWNHIAITRSGNSIKMFLNGVQQGSTYTTSLSYGANSSGFIIGINFDGNGAVTGNISNVRIVKGTAVYTSAFTPPTAPLAAIANTSLLICQDNNFIDEGPNNFAITRNGDVLIQPYSPFAPGLLSSNSHSVYFDGTGDYLNVSNATAFNLSTGDWTIECWINLSALTAEARIWSLGTYGSNPEVALLIGGGGAGGSSNDLQFNYLGNSTLITASSVNSVGAWAHVAVVRSSGTTTLYVNGVSKGTTATNPWTSSSTSLWIGGWSQNNNQMTGSISNFRVVKGTAVYTSAFTPPTSALTAITNTSLLACQSATLIDNSTNAFTITAFGDARPRTFNPFGQTYTSSAYTTANVGGSGYFDGTGDYLSTNSAITLSSNFTIECWFNLSSAQSDYKMLCGESISGGLYFTIRSSGVEAQFGAGSSTAASCSHTFTVGAWHHIALVRNSGTVSIYIDGVSKTVTNNSQAGSFVVQYVGVGYSTNYVFHGSISNFRIVSSAVYTKAFAPPSAPLTNIANTSLLCNFTNAQIFDQTAKIVLETVGDAKVSTAQYKYGSASMYFDGTGDYLFAPANKLFAFRTGDFTIEFWIRSTDSAGNLIGLVTNASGNWNLVIAGSALYWQSQYATTNLFNRSATGILDGAWHHVAITRASGTMRMFFDGTLQGATASDSTDYTAPNALQIGSSGVYGDFLGYIDDLRITKGYARYTANFTAPTAAFQDK